jgi:hypothetical protein
VKSLASENLQEIENLNGSERQKKEDIIKMTLGSIFVGNAHYDGWWTYTALKGIFFSQRVQTP